MRSRPVPSLLVLATLSLLAVAARAATAVETAARGLVARTLPAHAAQVSVEEISADADGHDVFEVETVGDHLVLRGNHGTAIGAGLNWYLRNIAHGQVSWNGNNLALPAVLPAVPARVRIATPFRHRVYLNYCTFNYTMTWWDRARWEREIDWMALHGVSMPLATTGQEAVWQAVLRRYGMNDGEIRGFLAGPAFSGWQWMTNLESWGGPLPQSWIDRHLELGRFILQRERELGMTPILQGFSGCVPLDFIRRFPRARILPKQIWCGIPPGTAQLDPEDPLFAEFGRAFLEEQTRLLGSDHLYAADPFHEGTPPLDTPAYLNRVGAALFKLVDDFDPHGTIIMQGWTPREGIVRGIPADRLLMLDLTGAKWKETGSFWDRPWVAGVLHNFGGRQFLGGNLPAIARNSLELLPQPAGRKLVGVGLFPEAIEHNPIVFELGLDIAWHRQPPELAAWVRGYVTARYGRDVPAAQRAWAVLRDTVYAQAEAEPQMETPLQSRPALALSTTSPWGSFKRNYEPAKLWPAWADLLAAAPELGGVDPYRYDLVDVARQCLADLAVPLQRGLAAAYASGDRTRFRETAAQFLDLIRDFDTLLGTRREFLLGRWLAAARGWGTTPAESDLYEWNARLLLTGWGPERDDGYLFDYSCRQWSGLVRSYYLVRWEKFLAYLEQQPPGYNETGLRRVDGRPANDANPFYRELSHWEYEWCARHEPSPTAPVGDPVGTARQLLAKWRPAMESSYPGFDWSGVLR